MRQKLLNKLLSGSESKPPEELRSVKIQLIMIKSETHNCSERLENQERLYRMWDDVHTEPRIVEISDTLTAV